MYSYDVAVGDASIKNKKLFTYKSSGKLEPGQLVVVSFRNKDVLGIVFNASRAPSKVKIKEISSRLNFTFSDNFLRLISWMNEYYPGSFGSIVQLFLPKTIKPKNQEIRVPAEQGVSIKLPTLTKEQSGVIKDINSSDRAHFLLHGDTGTGKTRVYQELAKQNKKNGRSSIILVPEISLSPQVAESFKTIFSSDVFIYHSRLAQSERNRLWWKIALSKKPVVIVGTRSSIFLPIPDPGLVILDESHDSSYKQTQSPNYDARRVAASLALINKGKAVYGSATPDIADYYNFKASGLPILRLKKPVSTDIKTPDIKTVDSSDRSKFSRSPIFSDTAVKLLETNLGNKRQSLIFLNRRGTSRIAICNACGWASTCPRCDANLVYHKDKHQMLCHICGLSQSPPTSCPECQSTDIVFRSHGTKSVIDEISRLFPHASVMRFDSDNPTSETLEKNFHHVVKNNVDIIVGTQIIAKGLHLPNLTLVCIPFAESGMLLPDYTGEEKSYQLLRQVVGRVGRTSEQSMVVVQSRKHDSPSIKQALSSNWGAYYDQQIHQRDKYNFPPFSYLLQLTIRRKTKKSAVENSKKLAKNISSKYKDIEILGPSPRFYEKTNGSYNWQLIIKSKNRSTLSKISKDLPSDWRCNIDPINLL